MSTKTFPFSFTYRKRNTNIKVNDFFVLNQKDYPEFTIADLQKQMQDEVGIDAIKNAVSKLPIQQKLNSVEMIALKDLRSNGDIQRDLDPKHALNILEAFESTNVLPLNVTKIVSKDGNITYTMNDGQHTGTVLACAVQAGKFKGYNEKNWGEFKVQAVVNDPAAFKKQAISAHALGRKIFANSNWHGKLNLAKYDKIKNLVLDYKFDGITSDKCVEAYTVAEICNQYGCFITHEKSEDKNAPGAITHIDGLLKLAKDGKKSNYKMLRFVLQQRQKFWDYANVDSGELGFYRALYETCQQNMITLSSANFQKFVEDAHAIIQNIFGNPEELKKQIITSYKKYRFCNYGESKPDIPNNISLAVVYQIYKILGGTFDLPTLNGVGIENTGKNLINYLPPVTIWEINQKLSDTEKLTVL